MTFRAKLKTDFRSIFLNLDEHAENVTYTPHGSAAKVIKAIVNRGPLDANSQDGGRMIERKCEILISTDTTYGAESINEGDDKFSLPVHEGGVAVDWAVNRIIKKDSGAWQLELQR